jgi:hypothetical protein
MKFFFQRRNEFTVIFYVVQITLANAYVMYNSSRNSENIKQVRSLLQDGALWLGHPLICVLHVNLRSFINSLC